MRTTEVTCDFCGADCNADHSDLIVKGFFEADICLVCRHRLKQLMDRKEWAENES